MLVTTKEQLKEMSNMNKIQKRGTTLLCYMMLHYEFKVKLIVVNKVSGHMIYWLIWKNMGCTLWCDWQMLM
jgi:hypothetical protein